MKAALLPFCAMLSSHTRVLVTGCGGMLGDAVYHLWKERTTLLPTDIDTREPWITHLDVRDRAALQKTFAEWKPDLVLHLAALTDVEFCEKHAADAFHTNAVGVENVALLCATAKIPLVYISTAGVFDGGKDVYTEYDEAHPINVYGRSKFGGEEAVRWHVPNAYIVRAGWMMGGGPQKDKKFINKIVKQLRAGKRELFVVDDKLGCPTYTRDFAANLINLVESQQYGLYHMVGEGSGSRYDVACELVKLLGMADTVTVTKVPSSHWQQEYFAARPASEHLHNLKLTLKGINRMRDWHESLRDYIAQYPWDLHA